MTGRLLIGLVAAAIAIGIGTRADVPAAHAAGVEFEEAACSFDLPDGQDPANVLCGFIEVPENRDDPDDDDTLRLAVAVLKATGSSPEDDPILYLSGGPGGPSLEGEMQAFGAEFAAPFQRDRDLVFYDQRGTGLSEPDMFCPETSALVLQEILDTYPPEETGERIDAQYIACRDRMVAEGVDLNAFSSADSAADIADLMEALGYDEYNIIGVSYGTRLALTTMRDRPQNIRSVVLDSTLPPQVSPITDTLRNFQRSVDQLLADCTASVACNTAYPNLEQVFYDLVVRANAQPLVVTIEGPDGPVDVSLDGDDILNGAFIAFYSTEIIPILPFATSDIAAGNTGVLTQLAQAILFAFSDISDGLATDIFCRDEAPFDNPASIGAATAGVHPIILGSAVGASTAQDVRDTIAFCEAWGADASDPIENRAVRSDIPTLILAGAYDPVTPPSWGRLAGETLSNSYYLEFEATGHAPFYGQYDCAAPIVAAFYDDPDHAPDAACVDALGPPDFVIQEIVAPVPTPAPSATSAPRPVGVIRAPDTGTGATQREGGAGPTMIALLLVVGSATVAIGAVRLRATRV